MDTMLMTTRRFARFAFFMISCIEPEISFNYYFVGLLAFCPKVPLNMSILKIRYRIDLIETTRRNFDIIEKILFHFKDDLSKNDEKHYNFCSLFLMYTLLTGNNVVQPGNNMCLKRSVPSQFN
jgi:hypothetical protein